VLKTAEGVTRRDDRDRLRFDGKRRGPNTPAGVPPLPRTAGSRVVDEDASHHLGGGAEEVRAILPVVVFVRDKSDVGLIDQGRRLQDVTRTLLAQQPSRQLP